MFEYECLKLGALQSRMLPQTLVQVVTLSDSDGASKMNEQLEEMINNQKLKIENIFERDNEEEILENKILKHFNLDKR